MLKHFYLGRRANFPAIFVSTAIVLFGVGVALLGITGAQPLVQTKNAFELLIATIGSAGAFVYFLYSQHHQDTQMFVSLFEKFNTRYDKLNEKLNAIVTRPDDTPLLPWQINTLFDYFNLCAEEYMFYEAGYIDERVWLAWLRGMRYFAGDAAVRRLWESEIESGSYYHFKMSLIDALDSLQPKG